MDLVLNETSVTTCLEQAKTITVSNNQEYEDAVILLNMTKKLYKMIEKKNKELINQTHKAHKAAIAQMKEDSEPVLNSEKIIKQKISEYLNECEKKEKEQQRMLEKKAREEAEKEALEAAQHADTQEEAEEIIQEAIETKPVIIAPKIVPKVKGINSRKVWKWRLKNIKEVNENFLTTNDKVIDATVKSMGLNSVNIIGGIEVYQETIISGSNK